MRDSKSLSLLFPNYPKTPHLPYQPNTSEGDVVADEAQMSFLYSSPTMFVEEKIDGANAGMMLLDGEWVLRNREHVLKKGYSKKETPAKLQFRPMWNWAVDNRQLFERLNALTLGPAGVYGEWLWALHGIEYNKLDDFFVAFDVCVDGNLLPPTQSRKFLEAAGFVCPPLLHTGPLTDWKQLDQMILQKSEWGPDQREGVVVKDDPDRRFKMIRSNYRQGARWSQEKITRQKLGRP